MAKQVSSSNNVPIARLLSVESQVSKITAEMEKLILISTQHGSRIKELIVAASNSVSQVEMMSTVTTTRFQHMNDLKALRKNLQSKYEELAVGTTEHSNEEADSKDTKAMVSKINDIQNEVSNSSFKANMEVNKLKMELKSSKKDYDELKRFVTVLETKLGAFIQDAKDSGMKTNIQMDDMPEMTYQPTSTARRASILNPDAGMPTTPQSHRHSFSVPQPAGGGIPFMQSGFPGGAHDPHLHSFAPHGAHDTHNMGVHAFSYPNQGMPSGAAYFPMPGQNLDAQQMQQLQIGYQQQMYFQNQHAAQLATQQQQQRGSVYAPGMLMTDSGMSTAAHTPGGSPAHMQHLNGPHSSMVHHDPAMYGMLGAHDAQSHAHMSAAHRILHPHGHYPAMHPGQHQHHAHNLSHEHHNSAHTGVDPELQLLQGLTVPAAINMSKEEKYYKTQFRAVKELIMASMECKDLASLEPEGLQAEVRHHRDASSGGGSEQQTTLSATAGADATTAAVAENSVQDGPTRRELLVKFDLRHRNRDLYRNMRRVKEVEKIAMNYADFCVTNAMNLVDEGAYRNFKEMVVKEHFDHRLGRKGEQRADAGVQTEECRGVKGGEGSPTRAAGGAAVAGGVYVSSDSVYSNAEGDANTSSTTAAEGANGMMSALQRLREQQSKLRDSSDIDVLAQLSLNMTKPALDFGEKLEPTLVQYSSTGRRQSLLQMGCVFEQDLRDPALRFLETTAKTIQEDEEQEDENCDYEGDGGSGSDRDDVYGSKPSSRGSATRTPSIPSIVSSPAGGARPSTLRKLSSFPTPTTGIALAGRKPSSAGNGRLSVRKFVASEAEHVDLQSLRVEMTALMDRKLLQLYQGLDDRWKGLDETNLSILQKMGKFQEVLVGINADSQRLQMTAQLLAQRVNKTDSRIFDALEPVYLALDEQKGNISALEGLMVDVARDLRNRGEPPVPVVVASQAELMTQFRKEQLPMDMLLRNSQHHHHHDAHQHNTNSGGGGTVSGGGGGDYILEGLTAPVPASANMSEYELEIILRQLKEYASLYEDMVHNYDRLNQRLLDEDMRRSGNFSLKKPHITRTVAVKPPAATIREIINTPFVSSAVEHLTPHPPSSDHHRDVVVHMPHTPRTTVGAGTITEHYPQQHHQQQQEEEHGAVGGRDATDDSGSPCLQSDTVATTTNTTTIATPLGSQTGPLPSRQPFASPHRVLTEPFRLHRSSGPAGDADVHNTTAAAIGSAHQSLAARMGPLTKRDLLKLVETSDLSANVEIIRIKNELARLRNSLLRQDTVSPTARQAGQHPPAVFPSLFSGLDSAGFSLAKTQAVSPTGNALRTKTPQSRAGRFVEPGKAVLAGALLSPAELHASQRDRHSLAVTNAQPKSAARTTRVDSAAPRPASSSHQPPTSTHVFEDSLSFAVLDTSGAPLLQGSAEDGLSAQSSVMVPLHADSPIAPEADISSYRPSCAEDEDGLSENSLSAYEFLIRPASQTQATTDEVLAMEPSNAVSAAAPAPTSAPPVNTSSIDTPVRSSMMTQPAASAPRGSLWGSAAAIGHTTLNSRVHPAAALLSPPRASLLAPAIATSPNVGGASGASAKRSTVLARDSAEYTRTLEQSLRAEAIAAGETRAFTLTGSVKTTGIPTPSPPVKTRPVVKSSAAGGSASTRQSLARTITTTVGGGGSREGGAAWSDEQVWQRDYGSVDSIGGTVASTPSVLLQGGEYVVHAGSAVHAGAGGAGNRVHSGGGGGGGSSNSGGLSAGNRVHSSGGGGGGGGSDRGVNKGTAGIASIGGNSYLSAGYQDPRDLAGSIDSLPANTSGNLGENAFD